MAFSHYTPFTTNHGLCGSADSTDFPVLALLSDARFKSLANGGHVQNASGYDLRPYATDGTTARVFELTNYNATLGTAELYYREPTLSASVDVGMRLYYGDAALTTNGSSTSTWSNSYLAVYHLGDGSTLSTADSTSRADNLTVEGGWGADVGKIGGGTYLSVPFAHQYFDTPTTPSPDSITFQFWNKVATGDAGGDWTVGFGPSAPPNARILSHAPYVDNNLYWDYEDATDGFGRIHTSYVGYYDAWTHVSLVYDNTTGLHAIYLNGALAISNTHFSTNPNKTGFIFNWDAQSGWGKRQIDEIRVSTVGRSASWVVADYNNQNAPSTFLTMGSETAIGSGTTYTHSASGGMQSGGHFTQVLTKTMAASGGLLSSGLGHASTRRVRLMLGGLQSAGHAPGASTRATLMLGGLQSAGAAIAAHTGVQTFAASGGLHSAGASLASVKHAIVAAGGLLSSGLGHSARQFAIVGLGGLQTSGHSPSFEKFVRTMAGGLQSSGVAGVTHTGIQVFIPSGGLQSGGHALAFSTIVKLGSGGLQFGGHVPPVRLYARVALGGLQLSGAARLAYQLRYVASGGLQSSGHVIEKYIFGGLIPAAFTGSVLIYPYLSGIPSLLAAFSNGAAIVAELGGIVHTLPE